MGVETPSCSHLLRRQVSSDSSGDMPFRPPLWRTVRHTAAIWMYFEVCIKTYVTAGHCSSCLKQTSRAQPVNTQDSSCFSAVRGDRSDPPHHHDALQHTIHLIDLQAAQSQETVKNADGQGL